MNEKFNISIIILLFIGSISYSKTKNVEEYLIISNSDTLEYSLGFFGDKEGASIMGQASHYQTSELAGDGSTSEYIYKYKEINDYVGLDYVELRSGRGDKDVIITKITINVELKIIRALVA